MELSWYNGAIMIRDRRYWGEHESWKKWIDELIVGIMASLSTRSIMNTKDYKRILAKGLILPCEDKSKSIRVRFSALGCLSL
jgi:hypothetical protein